MESSSTDNVMPEILRTLSYINDETPRLTYEFTKVNSDLGNVKPDGPVSLTALGDIAANLFSYLVTMNGLHDRQSHLVKLCDYIQNQLATMLTDYQSAGYQLPTELAQLQEAITGLSARNTAVLEAMVKRMTTAFALLTSIENRGMARFDPAAQQRMREINDRAGAIMRGRQRSV